MIVLVGFMGAGKSTVGRLLAAELGLPSTDTDAVIEQRTGRGIPEIFRTDGEPAFRDVEEAVVADVLAGPQAVVSLGGGACGREGTRERLRGHTVVHLDVSLAQVRERTRGDTSRPVLQRGDLEQLHADRRAVFTALADVEVVTDGQSAADVAAAVLGALAVLGTTRAGTPAPDGALPGAPQHSPEDA